MYRLTDNRWAVAGASLLAAAVSLSALWGFTVDDALIVARVAHHLALGEGHRFNVGGPLVDAVTPLGFGYLFIPFAKDIQAALDAARLLGAAAWLVAAAALGARVAQLQGSAWRCLPLSVLAACVPLAAWAGAGLETGFVAALCTLALSPGWLGGIAAGVAAGWRPELLPWAIALTVGQALAGGEARLRVALALLSGIGPALMFAMIRAVVFGDPAPLAVFAKPSDTSHGLFYAAASLLWSGAPALLLAFAPWRRVEVHVRVVALATAVHVVALVGAGGDWMPFARLLVPVLPGVFYVGAALAAVAHPLATVVRCALAAVPAVALSQELIPRAREVAASRQWLIQHLAPELADARRVAALDVGWVGAATRHDVVDLAGVTDPAVAHLPGGHTSKALPEGFVQRRGIDAFVLQLGAGEHLAHTWAATPFARTVERRVARDAADLPFEVTKVLEPPFRGAPRYVVLRLKDTYPTD